MKFKAEVEVDDVRDENHFWEAQITVDNVGVCIGAKDLGVADMEPGFGPPIILECNNGQYKLYVWADINDEDPTHIIDLDGAKEKNRKE